MIRRRWLESGVLRTVPGLLVLGYGLARPSDAQAMTGFELVPPKIALSPIFTPFSDQKSLAKTAFQPSHPSDDVILSLLTYYLLNHFGTGQQIQYLIEVLRRLDFGWGLKVVNK